MGPFRGRLSAAAILSLLPASAIGQTCAELRPGWREASEPTPVNEALFLLATGPSLFLLAATAVALFLRSQWGGLVVVVLWAGFITLLTTPAQSTAQKAAHASGCGGSPALFIGLVAAICVGTVLYTMPRTRGD